MWLRKQISRKYTGPPLLLAPWPSELPGAGQPWEGLPAVSTASALGSAGQELKSLSKASSGH